MRSEILTRIQDLLKNEDLEAIRKDVRSAIEEFHSLTKDAVRTQRLAWEEQERDPDDQFEYVAAPEEAALKEAMASFKTREKIWRQKIAEEQRANMETKIAMLERLRKTIQEEENIGAAFAVFNEVRKEWEGVGDVPGDRHKEIHDDYYRLRDEFFYNINIYKELQEHDLKKNLKLKEALLAEAEKIAAMESLSEREKAARNLQKKWMDVGPSPRETYKELADKFFAIVRPIHDAVKAHYDAIRASFDVNVKAKNELITELRAVASEEVEASHVGWQGATAKVIDLQKRWKEVGFAGREHNESLWSQFRELADVFFKQKQLFYDAQKAETQAHKAEKFSLIEKAEALKDSTDWKGTSAAMIALQAQWKASGSSAPSEEQRLWRKFRKAQDAFFKAKKTQFADRNASEKKNLAEKEALLEAIRKYALTGDRKADLEQLKIFSSQWNEIGFVPRNSLDQLMNDYRVALDEKYNSLSAQRSERSIDAYKQRAESLAEGDIRQIRREQAILRDKMDRLSGRITKTDENIGRFTGAGAEAIREQYEKSVLSDKREMDEIREKLRLLRDASARAEAPDS